MTNTDDDRIADRLDEDQERLIAATTPHGFALRRDGRVVVTRNYFPSVRVQRVRALKTNRRQRTTAANAVRG
jgi:hypothetical protein